MIEGSSPFILTELAYRSEDTSLPNVGMGKGHISIQIHGLLEDTTLPVRGCLSRFVQTEKY